MLCLLWYGRLNIARGHERQPLSSVLLTHLGRKTARSHDTFALLGSGAITPRPSLVGPRCHPLPGCHAPRIGTLVLWEFEILRSQGPGTMLE